MAFTKAALSEITGPRYLAIIELIQQAMIEGELKENERLPTHRSLAKLLGVTVGTITRAYTEAENKGLVRGEVGRGTYVIPNEFTSPSSLEFLQNSASMQNQVPTYNDADSGLNTTGFTFDCTSLAPTSHTGLEVIQSSLQQSATTETVNQLFSHSYSQVDDLVKSQFVDLLAMVNLQTDPSNIVLTNGAQHALSIIIAGLSEPGDIILTEQLSYPGIQATASRLHRRQVIGIEMDEEGIIPENLEHVCARYKPRFLLTVPNLHNPTGITVPESRRQDIVAVARRHDLIIIEDDVYCHLLENPPTSYATLAPDITCYVTSMTKSVASGLRTGAIVAPSEFVRRLSATLQSSVWMIAPLMAKISGDLITSGKLPQIFSEERREITKRQAIAREIFSEFTCSENHEAPFIWLTLPAPWKAVDFIEEAQELGIGLLPSWIFAINKDIAPESVRITLTGISDIAVLKQTLETLAELAQK